MVFPFVQCGLVAPLPVVVDGSPDSVSSLVGWGLMTSFTGRGLMVSQVVGLVVSFAVRSWGLYCVGLSG